MSIFPEIHAPPLIGKIYQENQVLDEWLYKYHLGNNFLISAWWWDRDIPGNSVNTLYMYPTWISNYIHYVIWDEITYPFPNFRGATLEV